MLIASISKVFCLLTIKILMNMRNSINYNKLLQQCYQTDYNDESLENRSIHITYKFSIIRYKNFSENFPETYVEYILLRFANYKL